MSSITSSPAVRVSQPDSVRRLLGAVRWKTRQLASLSGLTTLVIFVVCVFWATTGIDSGWFALQRLELPVGVRLIIGMILLPWGVWLLASRVCWPWLRQIDEEDVALLVEQRFPAFQNRLMTSLHAAHGYPAEGPMVPAMLNRTVTEAGQLAASVETGSVFDTRRLRRQGSIAGVLIVSIAAAALLAPQVVQRWWGAFVKCQPIYHERTTQLEATVIAQPGDRRVEFRSFNEELQYLHPRGQDLQLEFTVPEGGPEPGREWVVPERVRVDVIRSDGTRSRSFISRTAARSFRFSLSRLNEDVQVELLAGDFRTPAPYRIACVSPPTIDTMRLVCRYPEYTGWQTNRQSDLPVLGSEASLPLFTEVELLATANKPLNSVRIVTEWFELEGDRSSTRVITRDGHDLPQTDHPPLLDETGQTIRILLHIADPEQPTDGSGVARTGFGLPSNTALRFFLHDVDDVLSLTPEVLRIRGIEDQPPVIAVTLKGVGNSVTRRARVPLAGTIRDDYGIASAGFEFLIDDESTWRKRPFRRQPARGLAEFELRREADDATEVFDLQPLDLAEGQTLTLTVAAADLNSLSGPGEARGDPIVLRVVSNEELLALLYTREINLRRRFEEVISQLTETRDDLTFHRAAVKRLDSKDASIIAEDDAAAVNTCAARGSNNLRRQQNELHAIVDEFDEIIRQLINNAIPPQQLAENMRNQILLPLQQAADVSLPATDRAVSEFRVAALQRLPAEQLLLSATDSLTSLISSLRVILENVRDMAEFHEALRDLKAILEEQERLLEETRQMQKRNLIDKLKLLE